MCHFPFPYFFLVPGGMLVIEHVFLTVRDGPILKVELAAGDKATCHIEKKSPGLHLDAAFMSGYVKFLEGETMTGKVLLSAKADIQLSSIVFECERGVHMIGEEEVKSE